MKYKNKIKFTSYSRVEVNFFMIKFTKMQGLGNDFICTEFENTKQYNLKIFSQSIAR